MNIKTQISQLINTITLDQKIDEAIKQQKIAMINKLLETANKYITIVSKQGLLLQIHEGTTDRTVLEDLAELDKNRSRIHDSLISQITIINRLRASYGLDPIYQGGEARREKGDFALELVTDYFQDRI